MKRIAPNVLSDGEEIIAADASVAPAKRVIESPGKTRAGYRLNHRNASNAPSRGNNRNRPSLAPVSRENMIKVEAMMTSSTTPRPLNSYSIFEEFHALVHPS